MCKAGIESWYYDIAEWWGSHQKNIRFKEPLIQRFMVATPLPTIRDQRTLTGWVTPATEKTPPCNSGGFTLKGSAAMKKYYPVDFDEKGNAVLGRAKNTPTSNGFVPTTWTPGGGSEEEGDGIKSITITPAIETTPALDSLFPIYWDDLTEEQKQDGITLNLTSAQITDGEYSVTVTPSENWYALGVDTASENAGEPITFTENAVGNRLQIKFAASNTSDPGDDDMVVDITVKING